MGESPPTLWHSFFASWSMAPRRLFKIAVDRSASDMQKGRINGNVLAGNSVAP